MSGSQKYVIIGGGLAGAQAAEALRAHNAQGPVIFVAGEPHLPYLRPPLSKAFLQGTMPRDSVFIHDLDWYAARDIDLRRSTFAAHVRPGDKSVELADGTELEYDRLVLATGSSARRLGLPGEELDGVFHLRTLEDSEHVRAALQSGQRLVVVGAGWIGLEVAAAGRMAGLDVTILEHEHQPLGRVLGSLVGELFADLHAQHGSHLIMGASLESITGKSGSVTGVRLADGSTLPADVVVVGVGAQPNTDFLKTSGLVTTGGVRTDIYLQTDVPGVFAAGDIALTYYPCYDTHIRVEHVETARRQGFLAGQNMLGMAQPYGSLPFFYSDQFDVGLEYTGYAPQGGFDRVVLRGDVESFTFTAFWLLAHRVVAAMNVNQWDVRPALDALIASRIEVDAYRLADPSTPIPEPQPT